MTMPANAPDWARTTHYRKLDNNDKVVTMPIHSDGIREGDLGYYNASTKKVLTLPARSNDAAADDLIAQNFFGISTQTYPISHHARPAGQPGDTNLRAVFYIGDVIARLIMTAGEAIDHYTPVYPSATARLFTTVAAGRTEPIGHVVIDVGEGKTARTTSSGEEVSVVLRKSYILALGLPSNAS